MPSRWQLHLPGIDPALVRLEHVHAVVTRWLDADTAAHQANAKPYSVTPPVAVPDGTAIEVGLIDDALVDRLLSYAAPGVTVRLGNQRTRIAAAPRQVAGLAWTQLTAATTADAWSVRMLTPTTFRRGNAFTPWPAPKAILGGLRAAWRHHAPPDLPPIFLDLADDPVWVTDIDGANDVVKVNDRTVSGFVGRIRFTCDTPGEAGASVCASIDHLLQLAPYAGIGAYTTRGFGVARLEPTWRQRTTT